MLVLRSSMVGWLENCPSPDAEAGGSVFRKLFVHLHVAHACAAGSVADVALEPLDCIRLAFGRNLHAAIGQVPHPAVDPFTRRLGFREIAEADALHAAADHISPGEAHKRT